VGVVDRIATAIDHQQTGVDAVAERFLGDQFRGQLVVEPWIHQESAQRSKATRENV
jgi:hypothetical protein